MDKTFLNRKKQSLNLTSAETPVKLLKAKCLSYYVFADNTLLNMVKYYVNNTLLAAYHFTDFKYSLLLFTI